MLTGSLLALRWPRVLWLHVPVSLAILGIYLTGSDCPLTSLELALREQAGEPGYTGGFIGHYVTEPLGFPIHGDVHPGRHLRRRVPAQRDRLRPAPHPSAPQPHSVDRGYEPSHREASAVGS